VSEAADWLSADEKADARAIFEGKTSGVQACHFCAGIHARVAGLEPHQQPCPRVKRIERHPDGSVLAVEYWRPGAREMRIVYPADAYDDEDEQQD
jgi:hypothetical protein